MDRIRTPYCKLLSIFPFFLISLKRLMNSAFVYEPSDSNLMAEIKSSKLKGDSH